MFVCARHHERSVSLVSDSGLIAQQVVKFVVVPVPLCAETSPAAAARTTSTEESIVLWLCVCVYVREYDFEVDEIEMMPTQLVSRTTA